MRYLFFDEEFGNCSFPYNKIISLGYVLCDENFNILEQKDIVINHDSFFDPVFFKKDTDIKLAYSQQTYRQAPKFPYYYDLFKSLFSSDDTIYVGHSVENDLRGLADACSRYSLPQISFKALDAQLLCMNLKIHDKFNLVDLFTKLYTKEEAEELYIKYDIKPHSSDSDALLTMLYFKKLLEIVDLDAMIVKYPNIVFKLDEQFVKENIGSRMTNYLTKNYKDICYVHPITRVKFKIKNIDLVREQFKNKQFYFSKSCYANDYFMVQIILIYFKKLAVKVVNNIISVQNIIYYNDEDLSKIKAIILKAGIDETKINFISIKEFYHQNSQLVDETKEIILDYSNKLKESLTIDGQIFKGRKFKLYNDITSDNLLYFKINNFIKINGGEVVNKNEDIILCIDSSFCEFNKKNGNCQTIFELLSNHERYLDELLYDIYKPIVLKFQFNKYLTRQNKYQEGMFKGQKYYIQLEEKKHYIIRDLIARFILSQGGNIEKKQNDADISIISNMKQEEENCLSLHEFVIKYYQDIEKNMYEILNFDINYYLQ